jgi:predicted Zn-dependent peptidase
MKNFIIPFPIYEKKMENGINVTVIYRKGFRKLTALLAFPFGSLHKSFLGPNGQVLEIPDGTAHFLEHQMFKQEDKSNVSEAFAKLGAYDNAFTGHDQTVYMAESSENQEAVLQLLLSYTDQPFFQPDSVENEKDIIVQELLMYKDQPEEAMELNLRQGLFGQHQVSKDIGGTEETVRQVSSELLYQCYDAFYSPENARLIVAGDIDPEMVFHLASQWGTYQSKGFRPIEPTNASGKGENKNFNIEARAARPLISLAWADYDENPLKGRTFLKRRMQTNLLADLIFGRSGPLYWHLLKNNSFGSRFSGNYYATPYFSYLAVRADSSNPSELQEEIENYLASAEALALIKKENLERLKRKTLGDLLTQFENSEDIALNFLVADYYGYSFMDIPDILEEITVEELHQRFKQIFNSENLVTSIVQPLP